MRRQKHSFNSLELVILRADGRRPFEPLESRDLLLPKPFEVPLVFPLGFFAINISVDLPGLNYW